MAKKNTPNKSDTVATWKERLPECFALEDHRVASDAPEEDHAFELLAGLRKEGVVWADVRTAIKEFLAGQGKGAKHIKKQTNRARKHFRPWLTH